jgi:ferritin-like metal-binding protein YciE
MNTEKLDELFNRELGETYLTEKLILDLLSKPVAFPTARATTIETSLGQTQERVRRLERIFALTKTSPDATKRPALMGLAEFEPFIAAIEDPKAREVANLAALQTFQHHLVASYAKLTMWANLLRKPELAKVLNATLAEEQAALMTLSSVSDCGRTEDPKSTSLGQRLTAMYDRKR